MDTDIDNYSHKELLGVLRIEESELDEDILYTRAKSAIDRVQASQDFPDRDDVCEFFRRCFMRIAVVRGYEITETMRNGLALPPVPRVEERIDTETSSTPGRIVEKIPYQGALPTPVPNDYVVTNYTNKYAGGLVNPVKRETVTTTLVLNSKFRDYYIPEYVQSQSDRLRTRTLCTQYKPIYTNVTNTLACTTSLPPNTIQYEGCYETESFGQKGATSDFVVSLVDPFTNVVSMRLAGLEMMNGYYPISEYLGTNVFTITSFDYDPSANPPDPSNVQQTTFNIAEGSYSVTQMLTTLNTIFAGSTMPWGVQTTTAKYNQLTGKMRFEVNDASSNVLPRLYGIDLDFRYPGDPERPVYYNLGWLLGFRKPYYNYFTDYKHTFTTTHGIGINGNAAMNMMGTTYFLLEVEDFNNNHPQVLSYNPKTKYSYNIRDILATIANSAATNEILFEDSSDRIHKSRRYFGPVRIKKLRIRLLDEYGRPVDLVNAEFAIKLEIETLNSPYKNMIS